MVQKSTDLFDDDSSRGTTVVGNYFTENELKEEFSKLVGGYTALQLANASGCGIDAAKKWLAKKSLPNTASTFNMAQRMPIVRDWALKKVGMGGEAQMRALRKIVADEVSAQIDKRPPAESDRGSGASVKRVRSIR